MIDFLEKLKKTILVCDGAMGTVLYSKGVYLNKCFDELNLTNPSMVAQVHKDYVKAGADIIETNTFGANRFRLLSFGLEKKVRQINKKGAMLAREAAKDKSFVAGSIGPINAHLKPIGGVSREDLLSIYNEQIEGLLEGGVDILMFETFPGIEMLKVALEAASILTKIPVIAQITVNDDGNSLHEEPPELVARELENAGAHVLGLNCSVGPSVMLDSISRIRKVTSLPLIAQPNAGLPKIVEGRFIYLSSPEYMAEFAKRFIQNGVNIVGGCCGTTANHIKAIGAAVKAIQPEAVKIEIKSAKDSKKKIEINETPDKDKSPFASKLIKGTFVKCVEIDPPKGGGYGAVVDWVSTMKKSGIDAVNIADGPRASARMSPIALASIVEDKAKTDVILHFCCRDRNMLGMQSDLLGAHALGIKNILSVTGDPPKLGDYPNATAVFDVDSIGLLKIAQNLNRGFDLAGNAIGEKTAFFLGAGINPGALNLEEELRRFELKVESGAKFAMTQPVFDIKILENTLKKIERFKVPVLLGILPLYSLRNAEFLNNEVPGMSVPSNIMAKMKKAPTGDEAREVGIEIAREALDSCKSMVEGVHVMPPFGNYALATQVLDILD